MLRESPKLANMYLYAPQTNRVVGSFTGQSTGPPDAQAGATGAQPLASGA